MNIHLRRLNIGERGTIDGSSGEIIELLKARKNPHFDEFTFRYDKPQGPHDLVFDVIMAYEFVPFKSEAAEIVL
jgi:hypothetical protein